MAAKLKKTPEKKEPTEQEKLKKELKAKFMSLKKKEKALEGLKLKVDTAIRNLQPEFATKISRRPTN